MKSKQTAVTEIGPLSARGGRSGENSGGLGVPKPAHGVAGEIAVVDDDDTLRWLFSRLVERLGYRVSFSGRNGTEVVSAVLDEGVNPALIMMDYHMPIVNGLEAAADIRRSRPDIKILIASGDDDLKEEVKSLGIGFLQKPFSIHQLDVALRNALGEPGTLAATASEKKNDPKSQ